MYLNTVFKYNVFKYCPALTLKNRKKENKVFLNKQVENK